MARKPLIFPTTETDSIRETMNSPFLYEIGDPSYIPGYGDTIRANDIQNGRLSREEKETLYQQVGAAPGVLPVDFKWVRVSAPGGGQSYSADVDAAEYRRRGYRPCKVADFARLTELYGYQLPPAARIAEDGSIRREDTELFFVDGDRARAYDAWIAQQNELLEKPADVAGRDSHVRINVEEEKRRTFTQQSAVDPAFET